MSETKEHGQVWSLSELKEYQKRGVVPQEPKKSKYNNVKVEADGFTFDSKKEYSRYLDLKAQVKSGEISELQHHVTFTFVHNGIKIGGYEADFTYNRGGKEVVEDVKSKATIGLPVYRLKKKMMLAFFNIEIKEV
jgi:hypothetical protein